MKLYESLVLKFGHNELQKLKKGDEMFVFQNEMEIFWSDHFNWENPFEVSNVLKYGVPSVFVNRFISTLNKKFPHILMQNPILNSITRDFVTYPQDESLQIIQIYTTNYVLVHAHDKKITIFSFHNEKLEDLEIETLFKKRYPNHTESIEFVHHECFSNDIHLSGIVCCIISYSILNESEIPSLDSGAEMFGEWFKSVLFSSELVDLNAEPDVDTPNVVTSNLPEEPKPANRKRKRQKEN